ncbi:hypothetical protein B566_EDAN017277 [Ephemera danica]|nr:hypothetical protein B566_EDAN017277 [Ephemera danica]
MSASSWVVVWCLLLARTERAQSVPKSCDVPCSQGPAVTTVQPSMLHSRQHICCLFSAVHSVGRVGSCAVMGTPLSRGRDVVPRACGQDKTWASFVSAPCLSVEQTITYCDPRGLYSGIENRDEIYSCSQLTAGAEKQESGEDEQEPPPLQQVLEEEAAPPPAVASAPKPPVVQPQRSTPPPLLSLQGDTSSYPLPQGATAKIFVPRTDDMSKGFLMFSEDEPGVTMLKEEPDPDDLTHLAPEAGDVCVSLESSPFLEDMFEDLMMQSYPMFPGDSCAGLLPGEEEEDEGRPSSSSSSGHNRAGSPPCDPFLQPYSNDNTSPSSCSPSDPRMLSPSSLQSPDGGSMPSLCSDSADSPASVALGSPPALVDDDEEMSMRAPYIAEEELPLLVSADLMWGALTPPPDVQEPKSSSTSPTSSGQASPSINSNLAQLLLSEGEEKQLSPPPPLAHLLPGRKINDHGGGLVNPSEVLGQAPHPHKDWKSSKVEASRTGGKLAPTPPKRVALESPMGDVAKRAKHMGSSELLQHLIGPRAAACWEGGGNRSKLVAASSSNSVLMNLLVSGCDVSAGYVCMPTVRVTKTLSNSRAVSRSAATASLFENVETEKKALLRKRSFSLLEPDGRAVPSLLELSQQDFEVNAPAQETDLLQGRELLSALEVEALLLG